MPRSRLQKILREPLLHFLVLGGALFLLGRATSDGSGPMDRRIVIGPGDIEQLVATFAKTWQRPPTATELEGLIDERIREEVYYRESLALGLDRDDTIIRRRLRQKMEFLSEDLAATLEPSDEELRTYLDAHADDYAIEPKLSFQQIFFSTDRGVEAALAAASKLLATLPSSDRVDPSSYGDPTLLPAGLELASRSEIERVFGSGFVRQLLKVEADGWTGPIESTFGVHLVRILERVEGRTPELEEVRPFVERDWRSMKREETNDALYRTLLERYKVFVQRPAELVGDEG